MLEKDFSNQVLSLDVEGAVLQGTVLLLQQKKPVIDRVFSIPLDSADDHVKLVYKDAEEEAIFKELFNTSLVVASLPSKDVLVRPLYVKLLKDKQIEGALAFQAEPLIPYPIEDGILDYLTIKKDKEGSFLSIFSAKKEKVESQINFLKNLGAEPEILSAPSFALKLFRDFFIQEEAPFFLLHFNENSVLVLSFNEQELKGSQTLTHSGSLLNLTEESPFFKDLSRVFSALEKQSGLVFSKVALTGKDTSLNEVIKALPLLKKEKITPKDLSSTPLSPEKLSKYALSIGLGISGLDVQKDQINFRQNSFSYKDVWKHLKKPFIIYFSSLLLLSASFFLFGKAYKNYQETKIAQSYADLLFNLNLSPLETEKEFSSSLGLPNEESKTIYSYSLSDLSNRLNFVENKVKKNETPFPLFPNVPRVLDVLAFLGNLSEEASKKGSNEPIRLENFSYKFLKKPEKNKIKEKYQVFVDFEFSTSSPSVARQFHELLVAPNSIIDPKNEVKWSTNKGFYKASFFLKDKTNYSG